MQTTAPNALFKAGRLQAGLTQNQVAEKVKIRQEYLSKIETGAVKPGLPVMRKLAAFYDLRLNEQEILKMYVDQRKRDTGQTPEEEALLRAFRNQNLQECLRILSENLK